MSTQLRRTPLYDAIQLFANGLNTAQIAKLCNQPEAAVYNFLAKQRETRAAK